jgi:4-hydroxybenzoate polyprenyltransferase
MTDAAFFVDRPKYSDTLSPGSVTMQHTITTQDRTETHPGCSSSHAPNYSKQRSLNYHFHTLLLFTYDQFFDTIIPGTIFGLLATLSGPSLALPPPSFLSILTRTPLISTWLWLIILQFCLQNQCSTGSPEEDALNKPWRPIPSQRISLGNAKKLLRATHVVAGLTSWYLGTIYPFVAWTALSILYNDLGGSDRSGLVRNIFCGGFFTCSFGGALMIALGPVDMSKDAIQWTLLVCCCILLTTIQTQEFRDEFGDRARGRRTLVTELGRTRALWTVYGTVGFWSL